MSEFCEILNLVAPIQKLTLRSQKIHAFEQIDRAQQQIAEGHLPILTSDAVDREEVK